MKWTYASIDSTNVLVRVCRLHSPYVILLRNSSKSPFSLLQHITQLFEEIRKVRNWNVLGHHFIFSDTWNDDAGLLSEYGAFVAGSLSFKFGSDFEVILELYSLFHK